jgi:hypothetical protein
VGGKTVFKYNPKRILERATQCLKVFFLGIDGAPAYIRPSSIYNLHTQSTWFVIKLSCGTQGRREGEKEVGKSSAIT